MTTKTISFSIAKTKKHFATLFHTFLAVKQHNTLNFKLSFTSDKRLAIFLADWQEEEEKNNSENMPPNPSPRGGCH